MQGYWSDSWLCLCRFDARTTFQVAGSLDFVDISQNLGPYLPIAKSCNLGPCFFAIGHARCIHEVRHRQHLDLEEGTMR